MKGHENKLNFAYVLLSQFSIVLIGIVIIAAADLSWILWFSSPAVDTLLGVIAAVITYTVMYLVYLYGGKVSAQLTADVKKMGYHFSGYSWSKLILIATLAGVGEELLFRVALQTWFAENINIYLAILAPALIFGLLHFISFTYFIVATLMGLVFGFAYYFTQSIALIMVWHGVYDLIALAVLVKYPHLIGIDFEQETSSLLG
ncbi:MAG TPA: type II CAAX endopeptidase family protein [Cellvibrio sp.]|nr:type II CAAX endopeptidase family protein [Cellvibrio sp.]